jgi:hypothetical protein
MGGMTESGNQPEPICVIPYQVSNSRFLLRLLSPVVFGLIGVIFLGLLFPPVVYIVELLWVVIIGYSLVVSIWPYLLSRRIEFYEEYVRVIPRRGESMDVPYGGLIFRTEFWKRGSRTLAELYYQGEGKPPLILGDRQVESLNVTLFQWLAAKIGHPPDEIKLSSQMMDTRLKLHRSRLYLMIAMPIAMGLILAVGGLYIVLAPVDGGMPPLGAFFVLFGLVLVGMGSFFLLSVTKKERAIRKRMGT